MYNVVYYKGIMPIHLFSVNLCMPKQNNKQQIESLIAGGVIGAALGALISNKKGEGVVLGSIAGAAIAASMDAYERAKKTGLSMLMEENDTLYEIRSNGRKKKIKDLPVAHTRLRKRFDLD